MHPIDHYETLRRGREELLKRAEYERMARKAMVEHRVNRNIHHSVNWLGMHLVSWGQKFEQFAAFAKRQPAQMTATQAGVRQLSKMSPHN